MPEFKLRSYYQPTGDQPEAIEALVAGLQRGYKHQVLLGATGTGKTFTIANVIDRRAAADAGPGAQQDAGRPALRRVQGLLPRERRRVLRLLLRLLPAGGLRPAARPVHREGDRDQRGDRAAAALGHDVGHLAARRDHRRLGLVHLRHRQPGGLRQRGRQAEGRRAATGATPSCASWSSASTSATTWSCAPGHVPRARRHAGGHPGLRRARPAHQLLRRRDRAHRRSSTA